MKKLLVVKAALLVVAVACVFVALAGCGVGGGAGVVSHSGSLEGNVFVPGGK